MSTIIQSTVKDLPKQLAKSGVSADRHVVATVLSDEEFTKLEKLRADIQVGIDQAERSEVAPLDMGTLISNLQNKSTKTVISK